MVSITSVSRYVKSALCYQSRSSMFIRGLIPRNWPRQFRLLMAYALCQIWNIHVQLANSLLCARASYEFRLWRDWVDARARPSFRWSPIRKVPPSHGLVHIFKLIKIYSNSTRPFYSLTFSSYQSSINIHVCFFVTFSKLLSSFGKYKLTWKLYTRS